MRSRTPTLLATVALAIASVAGLAACGGTDEPAPVGTTGTAARAAASSGDGWQQASLPVSLRAGKWWAVCAVTNSNGATLDAFYSGADENGRNPYAKERRVALWAPRCDGRAIVIKPEAYAGIRTVELSGGGIDQVRIQAIERGGPPTSASPQRR